MNTAATIQTKNVPAVVTRLRAFCTCRVEFYFDGTDYVGLRNQLGSWELYRSDRGIETFLGYAGDGTCAELDRLHAQAPCERLDSGRSEPTIIGSNLGRMPVIIRA